jgi:hypothetical protein
MERQAVLERLGWRFIRIRGSAFFRDPARTMRVVFKKLEEAGVSPEGTEQPRTTDEESVVSAIRRRASELRAAWQEELNAENQGAFVSGEDERCIPPELETPTDVPRTVTGPRETVAQEAQSRNDSTTGGECGTETGNVERLLAALDKIIFPAVAGTEPRGSRRERLERWRSALAACDNTPEAVHAALAQCDRAIRNGKDGPKVLAAISEVFGS